MHFPFARGSVKSIAGLVMLVGVSGGAIAADMAPMPTKAPISPAPVLSPWTYSATLYGWVPLLNGSTTVKGRTVDVDVGYSELGDLIRRSEIPKDLFRIGGVFRSAQWSFLDFLRLGLLKSRTERKHDALARRRRTQRHGRGLCGFEVSRCSLPNWRRPMKLRGGERPVRRAPAPPSMFLPAAADGGRKPMPASPLQERSISVDLTRNADGTLSASGNVGWVDPLVGLRLRHQFAPGVNFVASGDVGGFGVGSKFSWQALAALNYDFCVRNNVTWSGMLGYKALFVDYSKGSGAHPLRIRHDHARPDHRHHGAVLVGQSAAVMFRVKHVLVAASIGLALALSACAGRPSQGVLVPVAQAAEGDVPCAGARCHNETALNY